MTLTAGRSATGPSETRLPAGFAVQLSPRAHVCDDGRSLVGGSFGRVLYLAERAAARVSPDRPLVVDDATAASLARSLLDSGMADPVWTDASRSRPVADVTVVVPVRDRAAQLDRLLGRLEELDPGLPVVVVDDGSLRPEEVAETAERHGARLVRHAVNRGPAAARNTGLAVVGTDLVVFCDSDITPEPGWLAAVRRHFDDPAVALVAPRVLGTSPRPDDGWLTRYEQARSSLDLGPRPSAVRPATPVSYLPSACLAARVAALGGGFDESMRVAEDVDLVWRTVAAGWTVRYDPAAVVRHDHRTRLRPWLERKAYYGTGAAPLARRHGDAVAPLVLTPWSAVVAVALLAQRRWSAPVALVAGAVTTVALSRRLGRSEKPLTTAATLTARGTAASVSQTRQALVRHHWPLAVLAATRSPRARRALVVAAVVDGVLDFRRTRPDLPVLGYVAARRLDDLAYGAGLWWGALRDRSPAALLPSIRRTPRR